MLGLRRFVFFVFAAIVATSAMVTMLTQLPSAREWVRKTANSAFRELLVGRLDISRLEGFSVLGVSGVDLAVYDVHQSRVIDVKGATVELDALELIRSLLTSRRLRLHVLKVEARAIDVALIKDASNQYTVASAFQPRKPVEDTQPSSTVILLDSIKVSHTHVHGAFEFNLMGLDLGMSIRPTILQANLSKVSIEMTKPQSLSAQLSGSVKLLTPKSDTSSESLLKNMQASLHCVGLASGIDATLDASVQNGFIRVEGRAPHVDSAHLQSIWPSVPKDLVFGLFLNAQGPMAHLETQLHARVDYDAESRSTEIPNGTLDISGSLRVVEPYALTLQAAAYLFDHDAKRRTKIDVEMNLNAKMQSSWVADMEIGMPAGLLFGEKTPAVYATAKMQGNALHGHLRLDEPGAQAGLDFKLLSQAQSSWPKFTSASFALKGAIPSLRAWPRLSNAFSGAVNLRGSGTVDLVGGHMKFSTEGQIRHLGGPSFQLREVNTSALVSGSLKNPSFKLTSEAHGVTLPMYSYGRLNVEATGSLNGIAMSGVASPMESSPRIGFAGRLNPKGKSISDIRISMTRSNVNAELAAREVRADAGTLYVRDLTIEGLGKPIRANLSRGQGNYIVNVNATWIELARIQRLFNIDGIEPHGDLGLEAHLQGRGRHVNGTIQAEVKNMSVSGVGKVDGTLGASCQDQSCDADIKAMMSSIGSVEAHLSLIPPNDGLALNAWERVRGKGEISAEFDLGAAWARVPRLQSLVSYAKGVAKVDVKVARSNSGALPQLDLLLKTKGLALRGAAPFEETSKIAVTTESKSLPPLQRGGRVAPVFKGPSWETSGVDIRSELTIHNGHVRTNTLLVDTHGVFLTLNGETKMLTKVAALNSFVQTDRMVRMPFSVHAVVPRRKIGNWPLPYRITDIEGDADVTLDAMGTVLNPYLKLQVHGHQIYTAGVHNPLKADLVLNANFNGKAFEMLATATGLGRQLVEAGVQGNASVNALLERERGAVSLTKARLQFYQLPLQGLWPTLNAHRKGSVDGVVDVSLGANPRLVASLDARNLAYRDVVFSNVLLKANTAEVTKTASLYMQQDKGGVFDAQMNAKVAWAKSNLPTPPEGVSISYHMDRFRIAPFAPFLGSISSELDGYLNSEAKLVLSKDLTQSKGSGYVEIAKGVIKPNAIATRVWDIHGKIYLSSSGEVKLPKLTARMGGGELRVTGSARTKGLHVHDAQAVISIDDGRKIPVHFAGSSYGDASGTVKVIAKNGNDELYLDVLIPKWDHELPRSLPGNLQSLDLDPHIEVGMRSPAGEFHPIMIQPVEPVRYSSPLTMKVHVKLGDHVWLKQDPNLRAQISGEVELKIRDGVSAAGELHLRRGYLEVAGKKFTVRDAVLTFDPSQPPSNPTIVATAEWKAPDDITVYADFVGPAQTGKMKLRSEPGYSEDQILSLLLTGSVDHSTAARVGSGGISSTTAAAAVAMGGGMVTKGINRGLSDVTHLDISAKIGSTQSNNPRPELAVQLSDDVTAQVAYNTGIQTPGQNPDRTLLMFDWNFVRQWSLYTTFGDRGTSIADLIWQYKY